jgi:hypothetical protein
MMAEFNQSSMSIAIDFQGSPQMLNEISDALTRSKSENRGRPRKGFSQRPRSDKIKIFRDDLNPPESWSQVAEELNNQ